MIYLSEICEEFDLTEHLIHKILLSYSNFLGVQLMNHNEIGYFVSEEYFNGLVETDETFKDYIIKPKLVSLYAGVKIPFDLESRLYFLLDENTIVYIGETNIISSRIAVHTENKVFDKVATFEIDKEDLRITEAVNILHYKPFYNKDILSPENYFREVIKRV